MRMTRGREFCVRVWTSVNVQGRISRKQMQIEARSEWDIGSVWMDHGQQNGTWWMEYVIHEIMWPWKVKVVCPDMPEAQYIKNSWRYTISYNGAPRGNGTTTVQTQCLQVTQSECTPFLNSTTAHKRPLSREIWQRELCLLRAQIPTELYDWNLKTKMVSDDAG